MKRHELIHQLGQLRQLAPRTEWVASSRDLILRAIQRPGAGPLLRPVDEPLAARFFGPFRRLVLPPVWTLVASLVLALVSGLTVNAAFYSLPGEPLYRVKLAFERTQLVLVSNTAKKAELKVEFAKNRVKEIEKLVAAPAVAPAAQRKVAQVVSRFTQEVTSVRHDLTKIPADQRTVFQIALSLEQAGSALATQFKPTTAKPATANQREIRQAVREAVAAAEATSLSALDVVVSHAGGATSSPPLPATEVAQYLEDKAARLRQQLAQLPAATAADAAVTRSLTVELDDARSEIVQGDFSAAVLALAEVRAKLDALTSVPTPVAAVPLPSPTASPVADEIPPATKVKGVSHQPAGEPPTTAGSADAVSPVIPLGDPEAAGTPADVSSPTRESTQDFIGNQQAEGGNQKAEPKF